jgi:hypothetical protein
MKRQCFGTQKIHRLKEIKLQIILQLEFPHSMAIYGQIKRHQINYLKTFAA